MGLRNGVRVLTTADKALMGLRNGVRVLATADKETCHLLIYDAVYSSRSLAFRTNVLRPSSRSKTKPNKHTDLYFDDTSAFHIFLFAAQPQEFFLDGLKKLEQRSHKCVELRGKYVNAFVQSRSLLFSL
jgi:hypothetical protein